MRLNVIWVWVTGAALTLRQTVASTSVEARPTMTAEASRVVGAKGILGALMLESRISGEYRKPHS